MLWERRHIALWDLDVSWVFRFVALLSVSLSLSACNVDNTIRGLFGDGRSIKSPTGLVLVSPSSSPGNDSTPTVEVSGIETSGRVRLFSDSSCSTEVGSAVPSGSTVNITTNSLSEGSYTFYALVESEDGKQSDCSSASVSYELNTTKSTATLSSTPSNPSNVTTLNIDVGGTDVVAYYYKVGVTDATDCTSSTGYSAQVAESTNITNDISALSDGSIIVCVIGEDSTGDIQSYASATSYSWTKDTTPPTVTIASSESDPTSANPISVTIDFSENVTGFVVGDITVTNGTAGNFVSVTGSQYTADITPSADGTVSVDIAAGMAQDGASNTNTAATQFSISYDSSAPTATFSGTPSDPSNVTTLNIDIAGTDVVAYYYKVGVAGSTDCTSSAGYSAQVAESTNITDDISALSDGSITVCVIGEDNAGNAQSHNSATPYSWTKDTAQPSVAITSSESDPTSASPIPVTIDFSENVTGFVVGDISVTNGTAGNFVSVTGSQYTADITPSAEGTVSVDIAAGVAQDGASNNNIAATQFNITYESGAPTATLSGTPSDPSNVTNLNIDVGGTDVVAYYYKVGVTGSTDCTSSAGYSSQVAEATNITDDISALSDGSITVCVTGEDSAGDTQSYTSATSYSWTKDTAQPTVTITSSESDPTNASPIPVTINFSENVTGFVVGDISVTNGTAGNFASVTGSQYTADITPSADGTVSIDIAADVAQDGASNNNIAATQFSLTYDSSAPTATLSGTPSDPSNVTTLNIDVAGTDVVAYYYKVGVTGSTDCTSSTGYSAQVVESTHITNDISALSDGSITVCAIGEDSAGNTQSYASATSYSWTKDTAQPSITITSSESDPTNASPIPVTINFSEDVTGFVVGDISVTNGTAGNFVSVTGSKYTADITPSADGTVSVDIAAGVAQDGASNNNTAATQFSITYDSSAPTAILSGTPSDPSNVTSLNIDVAGTGVVAYYYKVGVTGSTDCTSSAGYSSQVAESTNITNDISALSDGSVTVCVTGEDSAGNTQSYASATSYSWTKDTVQPTVTITSSESDPTNASPIPVTIDFSENVTGFAIGDISVTNGTAGNFVSVTGSQYTADITPSSDGTVSVDIAAGVAQDGASNNNTAATQLSLTYDSSAPTATLSGTPSDPSNVTTLNIDVAGTDVVAYYYKVGVTGSTDCTSSTGYSAQVAAATNITDDISALSDGSITVCAIGEDNVGNVQSYASATSYSWTKDTVQPTVTITSSESDPTNASPIPVTIDFSENVTGFAIGDISVTNGAAGNFVSVTGSQYTADITPSADGTVSVDVAASVAQDSAGNSNTAATQFNITYDSTAPTATLSGTPSDLSNVTTLNIDVGGTDVVAYYYKVGVNSSTDCSSSTGYSSQVNASTNITNDISGLADGSIEVCVIGEDSAGNPQAYASATSATWVKDTSQPTVTVTSSESGSTNTNPIPVTIDFSESVTGFAVGDISVTNGSAGNFVTVSGSQYTADITPSAEGAVSVDIAASVAQDGAGNNNTAATQFSTVYDITNPGSFTVNDGLAQASLTSTPSISWTASSDSGSGIDHYEYALGTSVGAIDLVGWTDNGTTTSVTHTGLSLTTNTTYYATVRAIDGAGNMTTVQGNGWIADTSNPTAPGSPALDNTISSLWASPPVSWSVSSDGAGGSGISHYEVQIHNASDDSVVAAWSTLSSGSSKGGLSLVDQSNYYAKVRAVDNAGNLSSEVQTSNWTARVGVTGFTQVTAGRDHSCGLTSDGKAYCWGDDVYGQLGDGGTDSDQDIPVAVDTTNLTSGSSFIQIKAGWVHTCGLTSDGQAYCWGRNNYSQLGEGGTSSEEDIPVAVNTTNLTSGSSFIQITGGYYHSCGLASDGKAYCWGYDGNGRLGDGGTDTDQNIPVLVDTTNLTSGSSFIQIAGGEYHTCGLASDGKAYCWGSDYDGKLGNGATTGDQGIPVAVDTTNLTSGSSFIQLVDKIYQHTCGLADDGQAYCWGKNANGQLGDGSISNQDIPVAVDTTNLTSGSSFIQITGGYSHTCGVASDGKAYCWGKDTSAQLGYSESTSDQYIPVAVDTTNLTSGSSFIQIAGGQYHTCGFTSDGEAYCWGSNYQGQVGYGGPSNTRYIPYIVDTSMITAKIKFIQTSVRDHHSCGLTSDGKAYCWGRGNDGERGDGGTTPGQATPVAVDTSNLTAGSSFIQIALGTYYTCGLASDGKAYCWGDDAYGMLGDGGTNTDKVIPVAVDTTNLTAGSSFVQIVAGFRHACGLTSDGKAYCWGWDFYGQLGDGGTNSDKNIPVAVDVTNLTAGSSFVQISAGSTHTCGLASDGKAYCWGSDGNGRLGDGNPISEKSIPVAVDTKNLTTGSSFTQIVAGNNHTCGLASDGKAFCWGWDGDGQLGYSGSTNDQSAPVLVDTTNLTTGSSFAQVVTGLNHTCGLANDGKAYCWGNDGNGRLGDGGSIANQGIPVAINTTNLTSGSSFVQITAGDAHTCGLNNEGKVFCWGGDNYGKLGDGGSNTDTSIPVLVDSSSL